MRFIDLNKIDNDPAWNTKAADAEQKVKDGEKKPGDLSSVWGDAKARLKKVSAGKCWYCEARQERADNAVDHFRPKSLYPWLAFKLNNFRYACTYCNSIRKNPETGESSGKGDHFPIFNMPRAATAAQVGSEDIVLIDPCVASDTGLIDFKDDGRPCAKYPKQAKRKQRAEDSIHYYHLDHPDLNESRRQLALNLKDWIDGADAVYCDLDQGDPRIEKAFSKFVESIARSLDKSAEFSVFARRYVCGFRDRVWIEDLLDRV